MEAAAKEKENPKPAQGTSAPAAAAAAGTGLSALGLDVTSAATTDLTFNADYASVIKDKRKFLEDCTAAYQSLVCVDVHEGSMVVSMEGSREQLTKLVESVKTHGFMMKSAAFAGAFPVSSFVGASEIVATGSSTCALSFCLRWRVDCLLTSVCCGDCNECVVYVESLCVHCAMSNG